MSNIRILVATHKIFPMPNDKNLYLPVLVGATKNYKKDIYFQRDDIGKNISFKNPNYNELTAVYWAWKNLKDVDAVGLVHYRRLFLSNGAKDEPIKKNEIEKIFKSNDVILPKKRKYYIETNKSHYIHAHNELPLIALEELIKNNYPEYLDSFKRVTNSRNAHMFNMFIMKKPFFDSYCNFIFGILGDLEGKIDISDYSVQESRVYGYISEILMDVWIYKNKVKFKEVSWYQIGKKHFLKKIFYFVLRKFGFGKGNTHF